MDADPQVWGTIADVYSEIDDDSHDDPARRATFRAFASKELTPVFARVGWSPRAGERDAVSILRKVPDEHGKKAAQTLLFLALEVRRCHTVHHVLHQCCVCDPTTVKKR